MVTVNDVFSATMALMDELSSVGSAVTSDTKEYEYRTVIGILNLLIGERKLLLGESGFFLQIENMDDSLIGIDDTYALSVLPYGLAANLLVDENPTAASFYEQRYEELRDKYLIRQTAIQGQIKNLYGGLEYGEFSRW